MSTELRLDEPGSLSRPGPIGRLVRLVFAAACAFALYTLAVAHEVLITTRVPDDFGWWFMIGLGFYLMPYVINIGFSVNWKRGSQIVVALLVVGAGGVGLWQSGSFWAPPLGWLMVAMTTYVYGHLGISFVLSAILGTPGCEMRAVPHLWTVVTGRQTAEHYCPGTLDRVDKWESRRARG